MKKIIIFLAIGLLLMGCHNDQSLIHQQNQDSTSSTQDTVTDNQEKGMTNMEITMTIDNQDFKITLEQNETTKALIKKFPMTITMKDLNDNEKYYYMDSDIPSHAQSLERIEAGDLMLFGNNCLVLFYESFSTSYTYTRLGKIQNRDSFLEVISQHDSIDVTFYQ